MKGQMSPELTEGTLPGCSSVLVLSIVDQLPVTPTQTSRTHSLVPPFCPEMDCKHSLWALFHFAYSVYETVTLM